MFFCDPCAKKRNWPTSWFKSTGKCETCGKHAVCNDVPSYALPANPPKPPKRKG